VTIQLPSDQPPPDRAPPNSAPQVRSIQYLRAVAAMMVVTFHIGASFGHDFAFGIAGVDLFFVISGFIMWMVTRQAEANAPDFLLRRLLRIAPLYWLITLFVAFAAHALPHWFPMDKPSFAHVALSMLFVPHLSQLGQDFPLVGQGWTLTYEMFFYIVFAATLAAFERAQFYALASVLVGCVLLGAVLNPASPIGKTYTSPLLLEFLFGVCACRLWLVGKALPIWASWLAIGAGFAGIALATLGAIRPPEPWLIGVPALAIVCGAVSLERRGALFQSRAFAFFGDASYALYLTHFLVVVGVSVLAARLNVHTFGIEYGVAFVAALIVGAATHLYIEKPMGRFLAARIGPGSALSRAPKAPPTKAAS
jgi:exopolysaccharide production protein ExoZ